MTHLWGTLVFVVLVVMLVSIHEYGHFLVARRFGVPVRIFSVGFGRALWHHRAKSGIEYRLGWLPIGGYTRMADASDPTLSAHERANAYDVQPVNHRTLIALAGPGANLLLALVIYWLLTTVGVPDMAPIVAAPPAGTPAAAAGLRAGDTVLSVDATPVLGWNDVRLAVVGHIISGHPLDLVVRRGNGPRREVVLDLSHLSTASAHPSREAGLTLDPGGTYRITARIGAVPAFILALNETRQMVMMTLRSFDQYVFGRRVSRVSASASHTSASAVDTGVSAVRSGFATFLTFVAFISINLGVVNLLPFPMLDGGQIVLLYGEAVTKKKLPPRARRTWSLAGVAVILAVAYASIYGL